MSLLFVKSGVVFMSTLLILSSCAVVSKDNTPETESVLIFETEINEKKDMRIANLEAKVLNLSRNLEDAEKIANKLRRSILLKHQETDSCLIANEKLLGELVHSKATLLNRGTKLEAVTLIAETTARIDAKDKQPLAGRKRLMVIRANQYLEDSKIELDKENYEGASYLCRKAGELVNLVELDKDPKNVQQGDSEISFSTPLYLVLLKNGNIRTSPSLDAEIAEVLKAGNQVFATGYKENWVKVKREDQLDAGCGWVHLSLLN